MCFLYNAHETLYRRECETATDVEREGPHIVRRIIFDVEQDNKELVF